MQEHPKTKGIQKPWLVSLCAVAIAGSGIALPSFAATLNTLENTPQTLLSQGQNLTGRGAVVRTPQRGPLRVRSGPGLNYRVLRTLSNGTRIVLSGRTNQDWVELQGGGWVTSIYLDFDASR